MKRFLEEARRLIRINSVSTNGNEEVANYAAALMQDRGLKTQIQHVTHSNESISKRQFNVIGILGDPLSDRKIRKGLLLNSHLDTVSPGIVENWTETGGDPFSATMKEGKVFGLGSADAKLDFLCKLHAVEKFREKKLKNPIYLVGTCGEEIGMFGAKYLIKSLSLNPKFVIVGEPSNLQTIYAHKCLNIFKVSIGYQLVERDARGFNRRIDLHSFGKSAHSAYPHLGTNAILASVEFLHRAIEHGFEMRFTHLDGGDTVNKVPDHAVTQFYLTSHQFEDFKRFFRETIKAEGKSKAFRVELGGVGDTGVRFLPDNLFPCLTDVVGFFKRTAIQLEEIKDDTYDPAFSTLNFGQLKQRVGTVEMHFDIRLLPELPPEELEQTIKKGLQAIATQYPSLNISVARENMNPGLNMSLEDQLLRICRESMDQAGIKPVFSKISTSTEAAQFFQAGYQAVVFGPGESQGNSHSPNENNVLEQLEKAIDFYEKVIEKVCL
jgi:acetylornithine deacetylase/succinyl-diaminopimelate desuccinylase-like protein